VVQEDSFAETASVTICLLTTAAADAPLIRPRIEPSVGNGLHEPSYAMADKITTVHRGRLGRRLGVLGSAAMSPVSRAMMLFLGLTAQRRRETGGDEIQGGGEA
jgi:mRNA interferase MazF